MTGRIGVNRAARGQAGVLGAAIVLTLGGGVWTAVVRVDHGSGPDTVASARAATLTTGDGSRLAVEGDHLKVGDVLVTGAAGRASVDVPDGRLELGPSTAIRVVGPRLAELLHGTAGLRLAHGSTPLSLQTGTVIATVDTSGAAVRVQRDYRVSAAALASTASLSGVDGSHLDVPALSEADVPGITLPASTIPVQQLDHAADGVDAAIAPALVQADVALDRLAAQVDADTVAHTALHPASFEATALPAAATHPSEIALTRAMGQAGTGDHDVDARRAVELRAAGAAWGIVAAELGVTVDQLRPIIDQMLAAPTLRALVPVVATQVVGPGSSATPTTTRGGGPTPVTTVPVRQPVSTTPRAPGGAPASAPTAPPSAAPSDPVGDLVGVVTGIIGLTPPPTPTPGPSPSPSPGLGSLLCPIVGVLGLC